MTRLLEDKQVERYRADGYLFPLDLFDRAQVERIRADTGRADDHRGQTHARRSMTIFDTAGAVLRNDKMPESAADHGSEPCM